MNRDKNAVTDAGNAPRISMRAFFALDAVKAQQEVQKSNAYGSSKHIEADEELERIAKQYGAEAYLRHSDYGTELAGAAFAHPQPAPVFGLDQEHGLKHSTEPALAAALSPVVAERKNSRALAAELERVKAQRDTLLAACKGLFQVIEARVSNAEVNNWQQLLAAARAAIAAAESEVQP